MTIEKIRKYKPCKRVDLSRVKEEIESVKAIAKTTEANAYSLHQVPVCGEVFLVADAKILNRHTHQSGRGNLRYLFDRGTTEYRGLAKELDNGEYRRLQ